MEMSFIPLYAINQRLLSAIDEETGEILISEAELDDILKNEEQGIEHFIGLYKNALATADAYRNEAKRLIDRARAAEHVAEKAMERLDKHQDGRTYECVAGKISYRKSTTCDEVDADAFNAWPNKALYGQYGDFKPDKKEIARALKTGAQIPGFKLTEHNNISIN